MKKKLRFLVEIETDKWQSAGWHVYIKLALIGMLIPVKKVTLFEPNSYKNWPKWKKNIQLGIYSSRAGIGE